MEFYDTLKVFRDHFLEWKNTNAIGIQDKMLLWKNIMWHNFVNTLSDDCVKKNVFTAGEFDVEDDINVELDIRYICKLLYEQATMPFYEKHFLISWARPYLHPLLKEECVPAI